jgi:hypothetical protein
VTRKIGLFFSVIAMCACSENVMRFDVVDAATDTALPSRDVVGVDRPDRVVPDVLDLTDVTLVSDVATSDVLCEPMVPATLRFGFEGGRTPTTTSFSLEPALTFRAEQRTGDMVTARCMTTIPTCGISGMVGVSDVREALANRQVQIAFGMARGMPILVGRDTRPVDGQVFVIERDGAQILVGDTCRVGGPGVCTDIPTGIQGLMDVLRALRDQELLRTQCAAFRSM